MEVLNPSSPVTRPPNLIKSKFVISQLFHSNSLPMRDPKTLLNPSTSRPPESEKSNVLLGAHVRNPLRKKQENQQRKRKHKSKIRLLPSEKPEDNPLDMPFAEMKKRPIPPGQDGLVPYEEALEHIKRSSMRHGHRKSDVAPDISRDQADCQHRKEQISGAHGQKRNNIWSFTDEQGHGSAARHKYRIILDCCITASAVVGAMMMSHWWSANDQSKLRGRFLKTGGALNSKFSQTSLSIMGLPATLIFAVALTTSPLTTYHYLHRGDKFINLFIVGTVGIGALAGKFAGEMDATQILLRVVPWCAILGMLLARIFAIVTTDNQRPTPSLQCDEKKQVILATGQHASGVR
ncbi:hypothetical protein QBC44DRAFT_385126 [Cladorrhinum sp. PSN332]|nr:hypothetical protein QBC44DRAFT_385126 [Cladorrhinum sp. PSN332]